MADESSNVREPELFGIHHTNKEESILTKNVFTTFFPVATALYLSSKGRPVKYLHVRNGNLDTTEILFEKAIGTDSASLKNISWDSETHPDLFANSANPPQMDMVPTLDKKQMLEFEVKLTVVPTHNRSKMTELIVRQNTQFSFAERLAYRHRDLVDVRPFTTDTLRNILGHEDRQLPFILHGLWKTVGSSMILDANKTVDVFFISDFAYLKILLDKFDRGSKSTRVAKVIRWIRSWIENYIENGTMRYKERGANVEHLKVTIYPTEHLSQLERDYDDLRLPIKDVWNIVPENSVRKMSPERRLDAALFSNFLIQSVQNASNLQDQDTHNLPV